MSERKGLFSQGLTSQEWEAAQENFYKDLAKIQLHTLPEGIQVDTHQFPYAAQAVRNAYESLDVVFRSTHSKRLKRSTFYATWHQDVIEFRLQTMLDQHPNKRSVELALRALNRLRTYYPALTWAQQWYETFCKVLQQKYPDQKFDDQVAEPLAN